MSEVRTHGNDWVRGRFARYMCNNIGQVDAHIRVVVRRYTEQLTPTVTFKQAESARLTFVQDVNALLNARVMLMALEALDHDIESIGSQSGSSQATGLGSMSLLSD